MKYGSCICGYYIERPENLIHRGGNDWQCPRCWGWFKESMAIDKIIDAMSKEQQAAAKDCLGDAMDIVSDIAGDMPYSRLFAITCSVTEKL